MFILCGIADEPTWPGWKPSVTSSWPAISRIVVASVDGPAAACTRAATHVEVERSRVDLADAGRARRPKPRWRGHRAPPASASLPASPPSRSSWSWAVPTGPLMPRSG